MTYDLFSEDEGEGAGTCAIHLHATVNRHFVLLWVVDYKIWEESCMGKF